MASDGNLPNPGPLRIVAYMTSWCPDCIDSHKLLKCSGIPFELVDVERIPGAEAEMREAAGGVRKVPTIVIEGPTGRQVLVEPGDAELSEALARLV